MLLLLLLLMMMMMMTIKVPILYVFSVLRGCVCKKNARRVVENETMFKKKFAVEKEGRRWWW